MVRKVITVSPASLPNPDAELISLINALASSRSAGASSRLARDKFNAERKDIATEEEGLVNLFQGADDPSARNFLEEGNLAPLLQQLTQSSDPTN